MATQAQVKRAAGLRLDVSSFKRLSEREAEEALRAAKTRLNREHQRKDRLRKGEPAILRRLKEKGLGIGSRVALSEGDSTPIPLRLRGRIVFVAEITRDYKVLVRDPEDPAATIPISPSFILLRPLRQE